MKNNWQLQQDVSNFDALSDDFDDYGYGESHEVSIGDEIESEEGEFGQYGIVLGVIRNFYGEPVCYKVWRNEDKCFDYIQASRVTMCEPCGSSEWSLGRIGYQKLENCYYNEETGDRIIW